MFELYVIFLLVTTGEAFVYVNESCPKVNSLLTKDLFKNIIQIKNWENMNNFKFPMVDLNFASSSNLHRIIFDDSYNYTAAGSCFNNFFEILENTTAHGAFYVVPYGNKFALRLETESDDGETDFLDYSIINYKVSKYFVGFNCTQVADEVSKQSLLVLRNPKTSRHSLKFMNFCARSEVKCSLFVKTSDDISYCGASNQKNLNFGLIIIIVIVFSYLN